MTRKRLWVIAGIFVSMACLVLVTFAMLPPRPGVTKANFDRIEEGMMLEEVEAIFGCRGAFLDNEIIAKNNEKEILWSAAPDGAIAIRFNQDNKVIKIERAASTRPTFWQRLRALIPF